MRSHRKKGQAEDQRRGNNDYNLELLGQIKNANEKGTNNGSNDGVSSEIYFMAGTVDYFCDETIGVEVRGECELVAYADDLALVPAQLGIDSLMLRWP